MRRWGWLILLVVLACLGGAREARAQINTCAISAPSLAFGSVNLVSGAATASDTFFIGCNTSVAATVSLCVAIDGGTSRHLTSGSATLPLIIESSVGASTQIGDGTTYPMEGPSSTSIAANGTGFIVLPIVGVIPSQAALATAGSYSASFGITIYATTSAVSTCAQVQAAASFTVTGTLSASATVATQCNVSTSGTMNFGTASLWTAPLTATANIIVACNATDTVTVALDNGATGSGPTARKMTAGANSVTYGIYQDSSRSIPWGNTVGTTQSANISGASSVTLTAYGQVPVQTGVVPGSYSDVVNVTITY